MTTARKAYTADERRRELVAATSAAPRPWVMVPIAPCPGCGALVVGGAAHGVACFRKAVTP